MPIAACCLDGPGHQDGLGSHSTDETAQSVLMPRYTQTTSCMVVDGDHILSRPQSGWRPHSEYTVVAILGTTGLVYGIKGKNELKLSAIWTTINFLFSLKTDLGYLNQQTLKQKSVHDMSHSWEQRKIERGHRKTQGLIVKFLKKTSQQGNTHP